MQKWILAVAVAGLFAGGASVYAGGGCCPASKAKTEAKVEKSGGCWDMLSKVNLTEDQKTQIAALKADCDQTKCSKSSRSKMISGMKAILTPEQLAACKAECAKQGDKDCPMLKTEAPADKAS